MIFSSLFERRSNVVDPVHPRDPGLARMFGLFTGSTDSGVAINADNAPEVMAVMACVRVIAETMGCLPLVLYKRLESDDKVKATEHPLYNLLRYQPNQWQTWSEFIEMMTAHVLLRGNAYAEIYTNGAGQITELIPRHPDRMMTYMVKNQRAFRHQPENGPARTLLQGEVFYVPGLSFDGVRGIDPIAYARNAIGLARVTEMYGSRFFANDARPSVILKHPGQLSPAARDNLRTSWEERHKSAARSHKPAILEEGLDVKEIGVDPEHAQFLETRKFQKDEIAGIFRVPPHMIGNLDKATFSNIEHQSRGFVDYTMLPWFTRFEQAIRRDLLTEAEKKNYFAEFLPDALLRGDTKSRYDAYAVGRNWGWLSVNDIRRRENMNLVEDGDVYLQPLNMQDAGQPDQSPDPAPSAPDKKDKEEKARGFDMAPVLERAAERIVRKEIKALRRAVDQKAPLEWFDAFYDEHRGFVEKTLGLPSSAAMAWCLQQRNQLSGDALEIVRTLAAWEADAVPRLVQFIKEELSDEA